GFRCLGILGCRFAKTELNLGRGARPFAEHLIAGIPLSVFARCVVALGAFLRLSTGSEQAGHGEHCKRQAGGAGKEVGKWRHGESPSKILRLILRISAWLGGKKMPAWPVLIA